MTQQESVNLFAFIVVCIRLNTIPIKASLVLDYKPDAVQQETWYILINGTWKIESMEDWERYRENHGQLTPLH